jgi:DDE superfamily endonuclease
MWQGDWSGQRLLEYALRTLFTWEGGVLILDDTVIPKPFATAIEGLAWVFSSQEHRPVSGFSLFLLVWTNGMLRIPLEIRLWHKGGASKYALALSGSAMPAIACAVTRTMSSSMLGTLQKPSRNGFVTMGGISCAASRGIGASMGTRSVTIGGTPTGLRLAG